MVLEAGCLLHHRYSRRHRRPTRLLYNMRLQRNLSAMVEVADPPLVCDCALLVHVLLLGPDGEVFPVYDALGPTVHCDGINIWHCSHSEATLWKTSR